MFISVEGIYRDGRIELSERPNDIHDDTKVIVTFLEPNDVDLLERGISEIDAAELRERLSTFAEDWGSPEMDIYDDYDKFKSNL